MRAPTALTLTLLATPFLALALSACSRDDAATTVAVTGTNKACTIAKAELPAGRIAFEFTNSADDVSELYVVTADGETKGEVENVTTGTTRSLTADLTAGDYKVRCKPGQTGSGISSPFTVTGKGGKAAAAPDRTVSFDAVDFTYENLDLASITAGQTVRFVMGNSGTQAHEFEVLGTDGKAVGEVAAVNPGEKGAATITFDTPGEYTYQCILVDPATKQKHSMLGMTGTFTVAAKA
jgi:plastocyanin